jgi:hypothetical protein
MNIQTISEVKVTTAALDADIKKNAKKRSIVSGNEKKPMPKPEKPLIVKDNAYHWETEDKNGKKGCVRISNFIIRPLFLIRHTETPLRVWELTNTRNETILIEFPAKYLSKSIEFVGLIESKGFFVPSWSSRQFVFIKEYLLGIEKAADLVGKLGQQPGSDLYAFSNGVFDGAAFHYVDEMGFVQAGGKTLFLPAYSSATADAERLYDNERKFYYEPGEADFATWAKQIFEVFGDNGAVAISFVIAALFRDLISLAGMKLPMLFLFGPIRTGKSFFGWAFKRLFGRYKPEDAISLEGTSTTKAVSRTLGQITNGLVRLDEYKNSIDKKHMGTLKGIYDGTGGDTAAFTNDTRTLSTHVTQGVVLAGQELPVKEPAILSRCIVLFFGKTEYTQAEKSAFYALNEMSENGLGKVLLEMLSHREKIKLAFVREFKEVEKRLKSEISADERILESASIILAPVKILSGVLAFPIPYEQVYQAVKAKALSQTDLMATSNEVSRFFEVFDNLAANKLIIEGVNYLIEPDKRANELSIYLHLETIHPKYYTEGAKINLQVLDKLTLENYLKLFPAFVSNKKGSTYPKTNDQGRQLRYWKFNAKKLNLDVLEKYVSKPDE